uniref:Uncharacterized protein n=1 Tax=Meloidogyne enterolobii TaxID=390850 RepID=A0A6V7VPY4_MELEN|nr:unnamed protein product [Meloidogyne enterolobii]
MERRRGACAKLRASRGVLQHAPRGESTVAGFWARNINLFLFYRFSALNADLFSEATPKQLFERN